MVCFTPREADGLGAWGIVIVMQSVGIGVVVVCSHGNWLKS